MYTFKLIFQVAFLLIAPTNEQAMTPEQIVQKQLDTYNNRDIDGFMSVMSQEIELYNFSDNTLLAKGHDAVKDLYSDLFEKSPNLHSELTNRIVLGHQVIDHESITGRMGNSEVIELVVIYEVRQEKIYKVSVMRP